MTDCMQLIRHTHTHTQTSSTRAHEKLTHVMVMCVDYGMFVDTRTRTQNASGGQTRAHVKNYWCVVVFLAPTALSHRILNIVSQG